MLGQSIDLFSKVRSLNFNYSNNSSDISDYYDKAANFTLLKYQIGILSTNKNDVEYGISGGYYRSYSRRNKLTVSLLNPNQYTTNELISKEYNFYNLNFSVGKRYKYKNEIISYSILIPLEITANYLNSVSTHSQDTVANINKEISQQWRNPTSYSTGLLLNFAISYKVFGRGYFTIDIGSGLQFDYSKGESSHYTRSADLISNTTSTKMEIYKIENIAYNMPIYFNIGIRYLIYNRMSK
jgi:hypothetical protein